MLKISFKNSFLILINSFILIVSNLTPSLKVNKPHDFIIITNIYFNICYNNVKRYGKRFLSRIFADNFISTLKHSDLIVIIGLPFKSKFK